MRLSEQVSKIMLAEHISPEEMRYMVDHAAITSVRGMNRRYVHWLFKIVGDSLVAMQHVYMLQVGAGTTKMMEDHEECLGSGCRDCGWVGQVDRWISDKKIPTHAVMPRYA